MIGLGTRGLSADTTYDTIRKAIELGYRHFDCSPIHKNDSEVGRAIADSIAEGKVNREELWVTTKLWNSSHKYNDVEQSVEATLERMGLDYVDLLLIEWPVAHERNIDFPSSEEEYLAEEEAPLIDTWTGLEDCLDEELTRHIGVSNCNIQTIEMLNSEGTLEVECLQVELHPFLPQQALYDYCRTNKLPMIGFAPLGSPGRSAEMRHPNEPFLLNEPAILEIATKHNITPVQAILAWSLTRKTAVIPCSSNAEHLAENLAAQDLKIDREDLRQLIVLPKFRFFKGELFTINGSPYKLTDFWEY